MGVDGANLCRLRKRMARCVSARKKEQTNNVQHCWKGKGKSVGLDQNETMKLYDILADVLYCVV